MRAVFLGAVALVAAAGFLMVIAFARWRRSTLRRLLNSSSIMETSRGPIECAFAGPDDGPPVLVLHGGLGGWDQAIGLAEDLQLTERFRVIAPSRPGYLRTPVESGRTIDDAADSMIALLDALGIESCPVVGISGGGPTAIALAARHSHRVHSLTMICAISHRHVQPGITTDSFLGRLLFSNLGAWFMDLFCWISLVCCRIAPAFMTGRILMMTELNSRQAIRGKVQHLAKHDPGRLVWVRRLLEYSFPMSPRKIGLNNDLAQFASLGPKVEGNIACPTFIVHGRIDGNVPVAHAEATLAASSHTESMIIDDASHLLWLHPRVGEVRERLNAFLERYARRAASNEGATGPAR